MHAYFDRFTIKMTKEQAMDAFHQGACDQDVKELLYHPTIRHMLDKIPASEIRAELKDYGAWDDEELTR